MSPPVDRRPEGNRRILGKFQWNFLNEKLEIRHPGNHSDLQQIPKEHPKQNSGDHVPTFWSATGRQLGGCSENSSGKSYTQIWRLCIDPLFSHRKVTRRMLRKFQWKILYTNLEIPTLWSATGSQPGGSSEFQWKILCKNREIMHRHLDRPLEGDQADPLKIPRRKPMHKSGDHELTCWSATGRQTGGSSEIRWKILTQICRLFTDPLIGHSKSTRRMLRKFQWKILSFLLTRANFGSRRIDGLGSDENSRHVR